MKKYKKLTNDKGYKLLNTGSVILVCTKDSKGVHNITTIAWQCPLDYDPVTKVLFISDVNHKGFDNLSKSKKFVVCIPHASQRKLVLDMGSVSGKKVDKLKKFKVPHFISETNKIAVPEDCIGYIECSLIQVIKHEGVGIVMGKAVNVRVDEKAFKDRLLSEKAAGKTLHHLGSKVFVLPEDRIVK